MTLGEYINQRISKGETFVGIMGHSVNCDLIQAAEHISQLHWNTGIRDTIPHQGQELIYLGEQAEPDYIIFKTNN